MLTRCRVAIMMMAGACALPWPAQARVSIEVNLATQTMHVASATGDYVWPISSARAGYRTPHGSYGIQRMEVMHRSHKYHNSPMPHSLFFTGGYAIHGTYSTAALGRPASHGCIRIAPGNAAALYRMVAAEGGRISITGAVPDYSHYAQRERTHATRTRMARARLRTIYAARRTVPMPAYGLRGGYGGDETGAALGYATVVAPSMRTWLRAPTGLLPNDDND